SPPYPDLHSFPTRRSSDLAATYDRLGIQAHPPFQEGGVGAAEVVIVVEIAFHEFPRLQGRILAVQSTLHCIADDEGVTARAVVRSEEHTSELQSRSDLVCR